MLPKAVALLFCFSQRSTRGTETETHGNNSFFNRLISAVQYIQERLSKYLIPWDTMPGHKTANKING